MRDVRCVSACFAYRLCLGSVSQCPCSMSAFQRMHGTQWKYKPLLQADTTTMPCMYQIPAHIMLVMFHSVCNTCMHSKREPLVQVDTMIVQAIGLLDDLDKELNTYAMRVREWYGWHFPEMTKIVADNIKYAKAVSLARSPRQYCFDCFFDGATCIETLKVHVRLLPVSRLLPEVRECWHYPSARPLGLTLM